MRRLKPPTGRPAGPVWRKVVLVALLLLTIAAAALFVGCVYFAIWSIDGRNDQFAMSAIFLLWAAVISGGLAAFVWSDV